MDPDRNPYSAILTVSLLLLSTLIQADDNPVTAPMEGLQAESVFAKTPVPVTAVAGESEDTAQAPSVRSAESTITVSSSPLPVAYEARKQLLLAKIELSNNRSNNALQLLRKIPDKATLNPDLWSDIWNLRSSIHARQQNYLQASKSLIQREHYLTGNERILNNQEQILDLLESMNPFEIREILSREADPTVIGWLELARVSIEYGSDPYYLDLELYNWRRLYSQHPAASILVKNKIGKALSVKTSPIRRIALILPLASDYGAAAQAIYNGFMAMHGSNTDPNKPLITLFDTGATEELIPAYYRQAATQDVDLIIGPLGKSAIDSLMQNTPITVRTLLLGYPSAPTYNPNLFQFGLLPEEEATQVADRAWQDGKRISAIFYPNNTWGKRLRHAFDNRWAELGGIVAESQSYDPAEIDYSQRIKNLLNIDDSIGRNRKLTTILRRNIDFQPRRRSDIDFVFVAGHPQQGRLIKPQLNFYNAHKLPVYSTSHIYSGNPDKINDTDLNNVIFNDMPWLLKKEGKIANLRQSMMADHDDNGFHRLFALGVDTYQLAINIPVIQVDSGMMIDGVTARLSVDEDQRIVRKLLFARFDEGLPKLLDNNIAGISVELPIPK